MIDGYNVPFRKQKHGMWIFTSSLEVSLPILLKHIVIDKSYLINSSTVAICLDLNYWRLWSDKRQPNICDNLVCEYIDQVRGHVIANRTEILFFISSEIHLVIETLSYYIDSENSAHWYHASYRLDSIACTVTKLLVGESIFHRKEHNLYPRKDRHWTKKWTRGHLVSICFY